MNHPECLIVGAGPAGLTAAVYLARYRRSVLVVDGGASRATYIPASHNYPGAVSGVSGKDLLAQLATQAKTYGAQIAHGLVESLETTEDGFVAHVEGEAIQARRVLLATGIVDDRPALPNHRELVYGGSIRYCPVCDAFEATDHRISVLGPLESAIRKALFLRTYSRKVGVLPLGRTLAKDDPRRAPLVEAGIGLADAPLADLDVNGKTIRAVMADGVEFEVDVLYLAMGAKVRNELAVKLGADCDESGNVMTREHQLTSVPNLYAAGDVTSGLDQISVAIGQAAIAATHMHQSLPPHFR